MNTPEAIDEIYRTQSRRVLATLIRLLGDFDLAEEALHDAFLAAAEQWPHSGLPANPRAWLVSAGRFRAIDRVRRAERMDGALPDLARRQMEIAGSNAAREESEIGDDRLRLIFTCCHPALAPEVQVALTLREVCDLTTEEIARAFFTPSATLAQRIVRGKSKIRDAGIPFTIPAASELKARLESCLTVIYLVFNEGYSASSGDSLTRGDLAGEAIRLGRLLAELLPDPEVQGLLALMLLQESRRLVRTTPTGDLVLLEHQDRSQWNHALIQEGRGLVERVLSAGRFGAYGLQAAIAAVHATARSAAETSWSRITALYDMLLVVHPSPVVELNRAVAVAMRDGPEAGLQLVEAVVAAGKLNDYHLTHAARADLLRRLGRVDEARAAYAQALSLVQQEPERRFLLARLQSL